MKKVLFICQANIGRSQMAEAFYNFYTQSTNASSAGVDDFGAKYNFTPTAEIINTMKDRGIDISNQRIKVVTPEMCAGVDQIIVLCAKNLCPDFLLENKKTIYREIEDPHQKSAVKITTIRDQIEETVTSIIADQTKH